MCNGYNQISSCNRFLDWMQSAIRVESRVSRWHVVTNLSDKFFTRIYYRDEWRRAGFLGRNGIVDSTRPKRKGVLSIGIVERSGWVQTDALARNVGC